MGTTKLQYLEGYTTEACSLLRKADQNAVNRLIDAFRKCVASKGTIYIVGNGGSASMASHFSQDLQRCHELFRSGGRATSLVDNSSALSALSNDYGYDQVFTRQMGNVSDEDLLLGITCSGNSQNILKAAALVKDVGGGVLGITGCRGGEFSKYCDIELNVPTWDPGLAEGIHCVLLHYIVGVLKESRLDKREQK